MFNLRVVVLYPIILCNKLRRNVKRSIICMSCYILRLSDLILLLTSIPFLRQPIIPIVLPSPVHLRSTTTRNWIKKLANFNDHSVHGKMEVGIDDCVNTIRKRKQKFMEMK